MKGTTKRALIATATADMSIQPLGKRGGEIDTGVYGTTYVAYMDVSTPIQKADQVEDPNGTKYSVVDVHVRDATAFLTHKEVILERQS